MRSFSSWFDTDMGKCVYTPEWVVKQAQLDLGTQKL